MRCAGGGQALAELRGLRRSRRLRAEVPLPSSLPTAEPLPLPGLLRSAPLCWTLLCCACSSYQYLCQMPPGYDK